jgi:hypothetical protein
VWIRSITRSELSGTLGRETTFRVASGAGEAASACREDSTFAGLQRAGRNEENEFELYEGTHESGLREEGMTDGEVEDRQAGHLPVLED